MPSRKPERFGVFGRLDPRLSALFKMPAAKMKPKAPIHAEPELPGPVARSVRVFDPGCHDFGELSEE